MYDPEQSPSRSRSVTPTPTQNEKRLNSLAYAQEVLEQLEHQTLQAITNPETRAFWLEKLSQIPKWKLLKLSDFSGRLEQVWKFFDDLKQPPHQDIPEYLRQLPEGKTEVGKRTIAYLDVIYSDAASNVKDDAEREWVSFMRSRGHNFVRCQRKGNLEVKR